MSRSVSIACWIVVFSPQIIENFRKSLGRRLILAVHLDMDCRRLGKYYRRCSTECPSYYDNSGRLLCTGRHYPYMPILVVSRFLLSMMTLLPMSNLPQSLRNVRTCLMKVKGEDYLDRHGLSMVLISPLLRLCSTLLDPKMPQQPSI